MLNYKVELALTGTMTQVPDSQKLFGVLVCMFAEKYGNERATKMTKAVLDKEIYISLSNVMPSGYLPMPEEYLIDRILVNDNLDSDLKKKYKAIKERSYIKVEQLETVLKYPENCEKVFDYVKQMDLQQLRASNESIHNDMPLLGTCPYSVPTVILSEINDEEKKKQYQHVSTYCFYFQVDDSDIGNDLRDILKGAVDNKEVIPLGKRGSQGMNTFRFMDITKQNMPTSKEGTYLNIGMLLPDKINFQSSRIKLFTSERRPFEMEKGWYDNFKKRYISFIAQGSVIYALEGLESVGKCIKSPFRENRDIVFGNGFMYPISLKER